MRTISGHVLSPRALNRATLARQWLLRRADLPALEAIEHLVGLQAQAPFAPYFGLWSRLEHFRAADLSALLLDRQAVRMVLMRGTVHLVSARDALLLRPLMQPVLDRDLRTNSAHAAAIAAMDLPTLAQSGRQLLAAQPLTLPELRTQLAQHYPNQDSASMVHAVRDLLPLVQVPPRGVWGRSGQPRLTTLEHWVGQPLVSQPSIEAVVLRYLNAFGPATINDLQTWCGLTRLRETVDQLRPQLITFKDEHGRELFDLPDAPRPTPDTPAPVRLLAEFDNLLLAYDDRTRVMSDAVRTRVFAAKNGLLPRVLLVDGFVAGLWTLTRERKTATLTLEPFQPLPKATTRELEREAERVLSLAANDAENGSVRVVVS